MSRYQKIYTMLLGTLMLVICAAMAPASRSWIDFNQGNIRGAMEQADSLDRLIFVDVYASWCTACKLMDESTFRASEVIDLVSEHFIPVKIDIESTEGKLFAAQENITTLPALLILDAQGQRLVKVDQALQTQEMIEMLKRYRVE